MFIKGIFIFLAIETLVMYIKNIISFFTNVSPMKRFKKQYHIHLICFIVIFIYTGISIGVDICHNHEDASSFHDDCAACRWLDQSQDTGSSITVVQVFMFSPDTKAPNFIIFDESSLPTQFYWFNFLTRSPPSSIS